MNISEAERLLVNASATGLAKIINQGGRYIWDAVGTFNGATLQLQFLGPDQATFINVTGASLTAAGAIAVDVAQGANVRVLITGGPPAGIFSDLVSSSIS